MKAKLYLLFIIFLLYCATLYIIETCFPKLKGQPFLWSDDYIVKAFIILTMVQFISIFLGGFLAAFVLPLWMLLVALFSFVVCAISIFAVACNGNGTIISKDDFVSQNYVNYVVCFCVLMGLYSGMFNLILLVMILGQKDSMSIEFSLGCYLFCSNLSNLCVYLTFPFLRKEDKYYLYISLPLILIAILLLLIGRWKKLYSLYSTQIDIIGIIYSKITTGVVRNPSFYSKSELFSDFESIENLSSMVLTESLLESKATMLSFSKLCIIFLTLVPYGICNSQVLSTYVTQSNYLLQPKITYFSVKSEFWVMIINSSGVITFLLLFAVLKNYNKFFKKNFSQFMPRIITSYLLILLSILSAGIVETVRLNIYWGSRSSIKPSPNVINQTIDNVTYSAANMSVFFMIPQLVFASLSEIFLATTCGPFLYEQSVGSMKYLAIAFIMGAVLPGGLGDLISLGLTMLLNMRMFDLSNINKRTFHNNTCCSFESRLDTWFYCLASCFFLMIMLSAFLLSKFKHYYQKQSTKEILANEALSNNN